MSLDWQLIAEAVTAAINRGSIGRPRSLRVTLHGTPDVAAVQRSVLQSCADWFGEEPEASSTGGASPDVTVSLARWKNGASALIGVSTSNDGTVGGDLTLLGTKGALYHRVDGGQA